MKEFCMFKVLLGNVTLALFLFAPVTKAQTAATLVGDVTDATGAVVPAATVKATNTATGVVRTVTTGKDGAFRVFPLNPGMYDVTASTTGFKTQVKCGVILEVASQVKVDLGSMRRQES